MIHNLAGIHRGSSFAAIAQKITGAIEKNDCAVRGATGIGDLQSLFIFFSSFARHPFGPANKFADPGKDSSPYT